MADRLIVTVNEVGDWKPAARKQGVSKGGVYEIQGPNGCKTIPTYTCCHCNNIFPVPENETEMGFCTLCHHRECLKCARELNGRCVPFEKKLKEMEDRDRLRRQLGE